ENGIDLNGDGEISYREARAVTSVKAMLGSSFQNAPFSAFPEFQCFTGIWTLPAGSFNNWTNLTTITLPKNIGTIDIDFADQAGAAAPSTDQTVFWNCPKLSYIKGKFASEDNKALIYKRKGETKSKLVKVCETIMAYSIPEGVDTIARYCFYHSRVKNVQFPKSLKVIGDCAFEHSAIEIVRFPLGDGSSKVNPDVDTCRVTTVYDRTFAHCYNLKKFEGARVNGKLKVCDYDRVLYRDTTVYAYALGANETKVVIPDDKNIKRLTDCLFEMVETDGTPLSSGKSKLEVIALPAGINTIGAHTFYNQAKLVQLYFHGGVVPAKCGAHALDNVNSDMWVYIPSGASVDDFAKKLNYDMVTTWETWNF
ncbi:MAG: leucine-rich repeat protein, partial [Bacteroidaceae bacterium]|nr:leucine-rich repeat protein [Bacteroidaceae bacterium]